MKRSPLQRYATKRKMRAALKRSPIRRKARRPRPGRDNKAHREWVLGKSCCVTGLYCDWVNRARTFVDDIVVGHHVKTSTNGGVGLKPADRWMVPLLQSLHEEIHQHGQDTFERKYGVDLAAIANRLWAESPHNPENQ